MSSMSCRGLNELPDLAVARPGIGASSAVAAARGESGARRVELEERREGEKVGERVRKKGGSHFYSHGRVPAGS
jgi:hypothetical protein